MNERYLYKAKRIDNGAWVKGLLTKMWGQLHIINPDDENTAYPIDENTICQCTGLRDKNRKLIWENDIVYARCNGLSGYGVIKYDKGSFVLIDKYGHDSDTLMHGFDFCRRRLSI